MKTYLFPGQGSQARGMGRKLFDSHPDLLAIADRVLGWSVREVCLEDPRRELDTTRFTQPAIYVVSALHWFERQAGEARPEVLAGHSLGEFNALLAAGCFDFETGLRLVQRRGELMARATDGAMAAVLNATVQEIQQVLAAHGLDEVDIANLNTPLQTVISGSLAQIEKARSLFQQGPGRMQCVPLNTSGAFHSRFMAPAPLAFEDFLGGFELQPPRIPVISNVTARPHGDDVAALLGQQITSPVRWFESIACIRERAAAAGEVAQFQEVGHGEVLTRLLAKIDAEMPRAAARPLHAAPVPEPSAEETVRRWNARHPVGTRVRSLRIQEELVTRTEALLLFRHRPAVYLDGYEGYFALDELEALS